MQDDRREGPPRWSGLFRIALIVFTLLAAAGVTTLVCRSGFFAVNRAEAAARFSAQAASSAPAPSSAAPSSAPPAPSDAASAPAAPAEAAKPLCVQVSLPQQTVTVFDAQGRAVRTFTCSSGKSGEETPTGTFTVSDRGKSFYNPQIKEGAYYWTRFDGAYLFHSVPFDRNYRMEPEEAEKLGTPASHGCIRLPVEDAKWIYDNIPKGTRVVIS